MQVGAPSEIMIELPVGDSDGFHTRFGRLSNPPHWRDGRLSCPGSFLITPEVLGACLRPGGFEHDGVTATCDRRGILALSTRVDSDFVRYELFPARWSDSGDPMIYLAVRYDR